MGKIHIDSRKESLPAGFFYPFKASDASTLLAGWWPGDLMLDLYFRRQPYFAGIMSADLSRVERKYLLTHWECRDPERLVQGGKRRQASHAPPAGSTVRVVVKALPHAAAKNVSALKHATLAALGQALKQFDAANRSWELRLEYVEGSSELRMMLDSGVVAGVIGKRRYPIETT